jgi:large repetitive protein
MNRRQTTFSAVQPSKPIQPHGALPVPVKLLTASLAVLFAQSAYATQYVYDQAGRLVEVVAPNGGSGTYAYDAVGNIVAIGNDATAALAISSFSPAQTSTGGQITISGNGFSPTSSQNTVTINGVSMPVTAATATSLSVTVPTNATSGNLQVTVGGSSATSASALVIGPALIVGADTGTGPTIALAANQSVSFTFSGTTGLGLSAALTGTSFGSSGSATISVQNPDGSALTSCTLQTDAGCVLPFLAQSGNYTVTVTAGATGAKGTLILNSDFTATLNSASAGVTFATSQIGQAATFSFNGNAGANLALAMTDNTFNGPVLVNVYQPNGTLWQSQRFSSGATTLVLNNLPATGNYLARVVPINNATGTVTVGLTQATQASITPNAAASTLQLNAFQQGLVTFTGTKGQALGLGVTGIATTPSGGSLTISILNPDGTELGTFTTSGKAGAFPLPYLPQSGTYTIAINPGSTATSMQLRLLSDATGTLNVSGTSAVFTPSATGQSASYTFTATADKWFGVVLSEDSFPGSTLATIYNPDGTVFQTLSAYVGSNQPVGIPVPWPAPAQSGTFTIRLSPPNVDYVGLNGNMGSIKLSLAGALNGTITQNATPSSVSLSAGQQMYYTFSGSAGAKLSLVLTNFSSTPAGGSLSGYVYKPDGTILSAIGLSGSTGSATLPALPATGNYSIQLVTTNASTFNVQVISDFTGAIPASSQLAVSLTTGQAASLTYPCTQGQPVNLTFGGNTYAGALNVYATDSNGTSLLSTTISGTTSSIRIPSAAVGGTCSLRIVPPSGTSGSMSIWIPQVVTGSMTVGAAATNVNVPAYEQGKYTFSATAGQALSIGVASLTTTPTGLPVTLTVLNPDGSTLLTQIVSTASANIPLPFLPQTGNYTLAVDPGTAAVTFAAQILPDVSGTIATDGTATAVSLPATGQPATYSFAGTTGQNLMVELAASNMAGRTTVQVYTPDGALWRTAYAYAYDNVDTLALPALPASGNYQIRVIPPAGVTGGFNLAVAPATALTVNAGAAAQSVAANSAGVYTFAGAAGQNLSLGVASLGFTPSGGKANVTVYNPDGSILGGFIASGSSASYGLPTLPTSGSYTIVVNPAGSAATFSLQVQADVSGTLTIGGTPTAFSAASVGLAGTYTFSGTAGQLLSVDLLSDTLSGTSTIRIVNPDGTVLQTEGLSPTTGPLNLVALPATGAYTVRVIPHNGSTGSVQVTLTQVQSATVSTGGPATAVTLAPGQQGNYTFTGTPGQFLSLILTGLSSGAQLTAVVKDPNGLTMLTSPTLSGANASVAMPALATAGTYTVTVSNPGTAAASFNLQFLNDTNGGTITPNGAFVAFTPAVPGQAAVYTFSGTAGQSFNQWFLGDTLSGTLQAQIYKPDGNEWMYTALSGSHADTYSPLSALPSTGTYSLRMVPASGDAGSITTGFASSSAFWPSSSTSVSGSATPTTPWISTFVGKVGQFLTINVGETSGLNTKITVTDPNGQAVATVTGKASSSTNYSTLLLPLPKLAVAGVYTVTIADLDSSASSYTLKVVPDLSGGSLTTDGSTTQLAPGAIGQGAYFTFAGTAGQAAVINTSWSSLNEGVTWAVYAPDGSLLQTPTGQTNTSSIFALTPSQTGTYTIRLEPTLPVISSASGSATIAISGASQLGVDGQTMSDSLAPGKSKWYVLNGTVGQELSLFATASGGTPAFTYYGPNGAYPISKSTSFAIPYLSANGTYPIQVGNSSGASASTSYTVGLESDAQGTLTVNGTPATLSYSSGYRSGSYTFNATAGQVYTVYANNDTYWGNATANIYNPDGTFNGNNSFAVSDTNGAGSCTFTPAKTGTYTVRVSPPASTGGSITGSINVGVTTPQTGSLSVGGSPTDISLAAGQSAAYSFSASAGQMLNVLLTNVSTTSGSYSIAAPNGSLIASGNMDSYTHTLAIPLPPLTVSGVYTLNLGTGNAAQSFTAQVASDTVGGALPPVGQTVSWSTTTGGSVDYTFSGSAGQSADIAIIDSAEAYGGKYSAYVYAPDGTQLAYSSFTTGHGFVLNALPTTGTYTLRLEATGVYTGTVGLKPVPGGPLTINSAATQDFLAPSQKASYTFAGTVGQGLSLLFTNYLPSPNNGCYMYLGGTGADGSTLNILWEPNRANGLGGTPYAIPLGPFTKNQTYTVTTSSFNDSTASNCWVSYGIQLIADTVDTLATNGTAKTFTSSTIGQAGTYTFSGTAGQNLLLNLSGNTFPAYSDWFVYVFKPDGTLLQTIAGNGNLGNSNPIGSPSASTPLPALPTTGTYTVKIAPPGTAVSTGSVTVSLQPYVNGGTLTAGASATSTTLPAGTGAVYTFSGNYGDLDSVAISSLSTTPSGGPVTIQILDATYGNNLGSCVISGTGGPCAFAPVDSNQSGVVYKVVVSPGTAAASYKIQLLNDSTSYMNGSTTESGTYGVSTAGQAADVWNGISIQHPRITLSGSTFTAPVKVVLYYRDAQYTTSVSAGPYTVNPGSTVVFDYYSFYPGLYPGNWQNNAFRIMPTTLGTGNINISVGLQPPSSGAVNTSYSSMSTATGSPYTFTYTGATAGQFYTLSLSSLSLSGVTSANLTITLPDGSTITQTLSGTGASIPLPPMPANGNVTVKIDPGTGTATWNMQLGSDAAKSVGVGGGTFAFTPSFAGQSLVDTFSASAGQSIRAYFTSDTLPSSQVSIYAASGGAALFTGTASGSTSSVDIPSGTFSTAGSYNLRFGTGSLGSGSVTMGLVSPVTGSMTVGAAATSLSLSTYQYASETFTANAGQSIGIGITSLATTPTGGTLKVKLVSPSGKTVLSTTTPSSAATAGLYPDPLTETGTYTLTLDPGNESATFKAQAVSDVTGTLTVGGVSATYAPTVVGQAASYTFAGTATQTRTVSLSGDTLTGNTVVNVYTPSGALLQTTTVVGSRKGGSATMTLSNLPATGNYIIRILPPSGVTSGQITVKVS